MSAKCEEPTSQTGLTTYIQRARSGVDLLRLVNSRPNLARYEQLAAHITTVINWTHAATDIATQRSSFLAFLLRFLLRLLLRFLLRLLPRLHKTPNFELF